MGSVLQAVVIDLSPNINYEKLIHLACDYQTVCSQDAVLRQYMFDSSECELMVRDFRRAVQFVVTRVEGIIKTR